MPNKSIFFYLRQQSCNAGKVIVCFLMISKIWKIFRQPKIWKIFRQRKSGESSIKEQTNEMQHFQIPTTQRITPSDGRRRSIRSRPCLLFLAELTNDICVIRDSRLETTDQFTMTTEQINSQQQPDSRHCNGKAALRIKRVAEQQSGLKELFHLINRFLTKLGRSWILVASAQRQDLCSTTRPSGESGLSQKSTLQCREYGWSSVARWAISSPDLVKTGEIWPPLAILILI